jgi:23S rRNA pseudouridine1911/1915/1917 synthase
MTKNLNQITYEKIVPPNLHHTRLDIALSSLLPDYSRSCLQKWITNDFVTVDGKKLRAKDKVAGGQIIRIFATLAKITELEPQSIALNIIYDDEDIIIINKPAGLITHPGAGNPNNTLLNALLYHYPELSKIPRGGIIHRLDKDTSGIMVVARNLTSHNKLTQDLQKREIKREYEAIVYGTMIAGGTISAPIGRHRAKRTLMSVKAGGRSATTHYRVIKHFQAFTHVKVSLETGRTHQIRVHLAHIGFPIVGDPAYCKINKISEKINPKLRLKLETFKRQALHAKRLELTHPHANELVSWEAPLPKDFADLLKALSMHGI